MTTAGVIFTILSMFLLFISTVLKTGSNIDDLILHQLLLIIGAILFISGIIMIVGGSIQKTILRVNVKLAEENETNF